MKPNLLHPIPVYLSRVEKDFTALQDANLHEPIGQVKRPQAPTKLYAQISWGMDKRISQGEGGALLDSDGYLLFRTSDLRDKYITLQIGDRIAQIGEEKAKQNVDLYLIAFKWMGHYPDQQGASLVKAYFEDRSPSRQK